MGRFARRSLQRLAWLAAAAAWLAAPCWAGLLAGARARAGDSPPGRAYNEAARRAVDRGLAYLARRQNPDGSFGVGGYARNVGVCSLAAMAWMAHGDAPNRGPYGDRVARTLRFVLSQCRESGFIQAPEASSHGPMYGHGFATLLLAESYGMAPELQIRDKLAKAVRLIIQSQNAEGGWRYQPVPEDADISVTVCQVMALRAARNAGLYVPSRTIARCVDYVKRCQNPDGGFMYRLPQRDPSRFPRSAAGVVALQSAGVYEGPEIERGLQYLMQFVPRPETYNRESHYFYGHYYAVQAMWLAGGPHWKTWYPAIRDTLTARQKPDGSWFDAISPEYGTAMACLILQMPENYLPIFQR